MPYETDERLKGFLDTNQLLREQLCAAVLGLDARFANIRPVQPRGGPDGGADIAATFRETHEAVIAIGFFNQASDTQSMRSAAVRKFSSDLRRLGERSSRIALFFFTNVALTSKQRDAMIKAAIGAGAFHCEVFDRERIRLILDSPEGLAIRFQYLRLPMSEAEQATFFAKWGDRINETISKQFNEATRILNRVQFLHEADASFDELGVFLKLDEEHPASRLGTVSMHARVLFPRPHGSLLGYQFSSIASDKKNETFRTSASELRFPEGNYSLDPQFLNHYRFPVHTFSVGAVGTLAMSGFKRRYSTLGIEAPFAPKSSFPIVLKDLEGAAIFVYLNDTLAKSVSELIVYTDRYKLAVHQKREWDIEEFLGGFEPEEGQSANPADPLRRLYLRYHPIYLDFHQRTPTRFANSFEVGSAEDLEQRFG
jgi:hypothetical protein